MMQSYAQNKIVLLDRYYNSEKAADSSGVVQYNHYTWEQKGYGGYSGWGIIFIKHGFKLSSLDVAPTAINLKYVSVYIITDPDNIKDNPKPNYMNAVDAATISDWVKNGGLLLLMGNDSANCDLIHFNLLANKFGITFTNETGNAVKNDVFEQGELIPNDTTIFKQSYKMFMKDISILKVQQPAVALIKKNNDVVIAIASYGKGKVFAVGDPWFYNEYFAGGRLPEDFDNYDAANDLVEWLVKNISR